MALEPITRKEKIIAGENLEPITRMEQFLKQYGGSGGSGGGSGVQPDWNQNDDTQPDYVKNRPFYTGDPVEIVLVEESTIPFSALGVLHIATLPSTFEATAGKTYKVYWDGATYECTCGVIGEVLFLGNLSIPDAGSDTGEPFFIAIVPNNGAKIYTADTSDSHTFSISGLVPDVVKIDEKYLPDTLATKSEVEAAQSMANSAQAAANSNKEALNCVISSAVTFTFDKQTSGRDTFVFNAFNYYKISDFNPAPEDVISFTGTSEDGTNRSTITTGNNCVGYGLFIVVAAAGRCSLTVNGSEGPVTMKFTAPSAGLYAQYVVDRPHPTAGTGKFTLRGSTGSLPINGLFLKSSTDGSDKRFRITVDDSGTISATEVT